MGQELWNKINRIAIVDMMEGGHITIEEGEVELKHLDSSKMENTFTKKTRDQTKTLNTTSRRGNRMRKTTQKSIFKANPQKRPQQ